MRPLVGACPDRQARAAPLPTRHSVVEGPKPRSPSQTNAKAFEVGGVGSFHPAVELGRMRRQNEELGMAELASPVQSGLELGAAVLSWPRSPSLQQLS